MTASVFPSSPPAAGVIPDTGGRSRLRRALPTVGLIVTTALFLRLQIGAGGALIVGFAVLTPLERLFRRHQQPVRRAGLRTDMFHLLFTGALNTGAALVAIVAWFIVLLPVTQGVRNPLFVAQPALLQAVEAFVLFEVMGYIVHRLMHEVPLFWRFHAIHHSSAPLDWISGARVHPVEGFIGGLIFAPPLLLIGIGPAPLGALTAIVGLWGVLLHANIRWRFRWMDGWWGTPDYHHWHHSNHPEARNRNYSAFLPVIDRICGTYWQPRDRRPEIYGIDEPVPDGWIRQIVHPFRRTAPSALLPTPHPAHMTSVVDPVPVVVGAGRLVPAPHPYPADAPDPADPNRWRMTSPAVPTAGSTGPDESHASSAAPVVWPAEVAGVAAVASVGWPVDDRVLLAQVGAGDRAALDALYRVHAGWLMARLQRRCDDRELVDTALQDTFLAAWKNARSFRGDGEVGAWLWGIAVRKLVDQRRRRRPAPVDPASVSGTSPWAQGTPSATEVASAEAELFASGIGGELAAALARIDPDLRAVMIVTAVDGLSTREAAILLGIPQGTVKTRLMRARTQLQERLT